jgi:hypothetical protein
MVKRKRTQRATPEATADTQFKLASIQLAERAGLLVGNAEMPNKLATDVVLEVPRGILRQLKQSLFDFLRDYKFAVTEFKGQSDPFTLRKFKINVARTIMFEEMHPDVPEGKILNLYVTARYPEEFLSLANKHPDKLSFIQDEKRRWLWHGTCFFQPMLIVVCRDLPLEPKYYEWLVFVPAGTQRWREIIQMFKEDNQFNLLLLMRKLRPKEFDMVIDVDEIIRQLPNEERAQWEEEWGELMERELLKNPDGILGPVSRNLAKLTPEQFAKLTENATPEQFAKLTENATPEQFAKLTENATPEQLEKAFVNIPTEELERLLKKRTEKGK